MRIVIKDCNGKIVEGAQIHLVEERYMRDGSGGLQVATDCYAKQVLFTKEGYFLSNPIVCDSMGISPDFVLIPVANDKKKGK